MASSERTSCYNRMARARLEEAHAHQSQYPHLATIIFCVIGVA
jgi:hypothetical protein